MARPLNRTFSFENDNEQALSSNGVQRLAYQSTNPYPSRDVAISPPPTYSSPPPNKPVSPPNPTHRNHPGAHPDSAYNRLRGQRTASIDNTGHPLPLPTDPSTSSGAPAPPPHAGHRRVPSSQTSQDGRYWGPELGYSQSTRTGSSATPGMDNLGAAAAGGGIAGIAMGVANTNERESGVEAMRAIENARGPDPYNGPAERRYDTPTDTPYIPRKPAPSQSLRQQDSYSSTMPLGAAAASAGSVTPGQATPRLNPSNRSDQSIPLGDYPTAYNGAGGLYEDNPYQRGPGWNTQMNQGHINPDDIADDGDDGFIPDPKRKSVLSLGRNSSHDILPAAAGGAAAGGVMGKLGGLLGRKRNNAPNTSGNYGPVPGQGMDHPRAEKSEWLSRQTTGNRKMRWVVGLIVGGVIIAAIVAGVIGGVIGSKKSKNSSSSSSESASQDDGNGDLTKNSAEIKQLMNNPNLHKVFPGVDYTPWGTQYPLCFTYPPSQNNVTRDMAVLSQLTNAVRLYGTDCNQTQMVLHAIDKLALTDMKVWLGVWIETNQTTNDRQIAQMYEILAGTKDLSIFKGVIVGNEALYRAGLDKATSEQDLITTLTGVKSNFTSKGYNLPVATSDLGDNWNSQLVGAVDMVMSNIHPFFAGVPATQAAAWTINFWDTHDKTLTQGTSKQQIIAETGWPSAGGSDCGTDAVCTTTNGVAVAGIHEMNTFMGDFVCQALANGTEYFWFEAFDEPWKVIYNTQGKDWEDKWGLMDPGRNLKSGLTIPDCGGKTVS